jgi:hypothetical protein
MGTRYYSRKFAEGALMMQYGVEGDEVMAIGGNWPKTKLAALRESIRKWEYLHRWIRNHPDSDPPKSYAESCALCHLYYNEDGGEMCADCPVFKKTGKGHCQDTPFVEYVRSTPSYFSDYDGDRKEALVAARKEIKFLKSLLPNA